MDYKPLYRTIDLQRLEFSLLVVTPKESFKEWLQEFKASQGLGRYRTYIPEEDSVWIIPKVDRFSEPGSFADFLDQLKPKMLLEELHRFGATPADLGRLPTKENFDEFMEVALRSGAFLISELEDHQGTTSDRAHR